MRNAHSWLAILPLAPLLLAPLLLAGTPGAAQEPAPALAATVMARLAALPDRTASFQAEKRLGSLAMPLHSSGRLVFRHPAHVEKITEAPRPERVVIDGDRISIASPGAPARELSLDAHPALRAMAGTIRAALAGDLATLRASYAIAATGSPASWRLVLQPLAPPVRAMIETVTLTGAGSDLLEFDMLQANGDAERMAIQPER